MGPFEEYADDLQDLSPHRPRPARPAAAGRHPARARLDHARGPGRPSGRAGGQGAAGRGRRRAAADRRPARGHRRAVQPPPGRPRTRSSPATPACWASSRPPASCTRTAWPRAAGSTPPSTACRPRPAAIAAAAVRPEPEGQAVQVGRPPVPARTTARGSCWPPTARSACPCRTTRRPSTAWARRCWPANSSPVICCSSAPTGRTGARSTTSPCTSATGAWCTRPTCGRSSPRRRSTGARYFGAVRLIPAIRVATADARRRHRARRRAATAEPDAHGHHRRPRRPPRPPRTTTTTTAPPTTTTTTTTAPVTTTTTTTAPATTDAPRRAPASPATSATEPATTTTRPRRPTPPRRRRTAVGRPHRHADARSAVREAPGGRGRRQAWTSLTRRDGIAPLARAVGKAANCGTRVAR